MKFSVMKSCYRVVENGLRVWKSNQVIKLSTKETFAALSFKETNVLNAENFQKKEL